MGYVQIGYMDIQDQCRSVCINVKLSKEEIQKYFFLRINNVYT